MITSFVSGVVAALLLSAALVYDGGQVLAARRTADNVAAAAARVGAQEVDIDALYRGNGVQLDVRRAEQAAVDAARGGGARRVSARVVGDRVDVQVEFDEQSVLRSMLGAGSRAAITGRASARVVRGVDDGVGG